MRPAPTWVDGSGKESGGSSTSAASESAASGSVGESNAASCSSISGGSSDSTLSNAEGGNEGKDEAGVWQKGFCCGEMPHGTRARSSSPRWHGSGRRPPDARGRPSQRTSLLTRKFSHPSETALFLSWNDTLFPTSELFCNLGLSRESPQVPPHLAGELRAWRTRLVNFITTALAYSDCVCIVTCSRSLWVEECVRRFVPELSHLLSAGGRVKVVYAWDEFPRKRRLRRQCLDMRPVLHRDWSLRFTDEERAEEATSAKRHAMQRICREFYSRYPGQTWKNMISIGDKPYERDALWDISFRLPLAHDVRTKTILLPPAPTLSQIAGQLEWATVALPRCVKADRDIDAHPESAWTTDALMHGLRSGSWFDAKSTTL